MFAPGPHPTKLQPWDEGTIPSSVIFRVDGLKQIKLQQSKQHVHKFASKLIKRVCMQLSARHFMFINCNSILQTRKMVTVVLSIG